jgi:hypothetical protein
VTATAANGTSPYDYDWSSTLGGAHYTAVGAVFTILATAPVGDYSATVIATDAAAPVQSVTNSLNFSVTAPAPKYAITITPPVNGAVTTTPATEAEAGQTVTINATPPAAMPIGTLTVVDADSGSVTVTGSTFTMPAKAVTVTVTFVEAGAAPDVLIDFETVTGLSSYGAGNSTVSGVEFAHENVLRGTLAADTKNGAAAGRFRHYAASNAFMATTTAFAQPISKITFVYGNYGSDNTAAFKVQVSSDGSTWTDVGEAVYDPAETNVPPVAATIDSIPANMTYVQFRTVSGNAGSRVNIDDIGIFHGVPGPTLSYSGATTITMGGSFALVFTLNGGTASGWQYTLESATREEITTGSVNTFNWTPPFAGTFYLTMTALDEASDPIATREVTLTVNPVDPDDPVVNITGDLTGTVNQAMHLTITLQNAVAADWYLDLRDPDAAEVTVYSWNDITGAFSFTPAKTGTYVLTATAVDGGDNPLASKVQNLVVSGIQEDPPILPLTLAMDGSGDFTFAVPVGYTLVRVEGAGTTLDAQGQFIWTTLTLGVDYTVSGGTVRILTSADTVGRMVRIWLN